MGSYQTRTGAVTLTVKNLRRSPAGTFYFRKVIPKHLRTIYGKSEIIKSLGRDEATAIRAVQRLSSHYEGEFKTIVTSGERERAVELLASFQLYCQLYLSAI